VGAVSAAVTFGEKSLARLPAALEFTRNFLFDFKDNYHCTSEDNDKAIPNMHQRSILQGIGLPRYARLALAILALTYALAAGLRTVGDLDLGWQLATGRWIVQHRHIPLTDVFSYTAAGKEWIYPALSQLLLYLGYVFGGYALLSWASAAACVCTIALLLRRCSFVGAALAIVSVPLIAACTATRAAMFSAVIFAAFVNVLWHYHRSGRGPLWALPLLMCLWVNLHLGFIAGLAMCGAYLALELNDAVISSRRSAALLRLKRGTPWLIATGIVTMLNPWGWRIYVALARQGDILQTHSKWVWEWMGLRLTPGALSEALAWREPKGALLWLILVATVAVVVCLVMQRFVSALILASAIYAVIHAIRMEGSFASIVVVIGGSVLTDALDTVPARRITERLKISAPCKAVAAVTMILALGSLVVLRTSDLVTNHFYLRRPLEFSTFGVGLSSWFPEKAADFLLRKRLPPNVFNDFNLGGFVTWKLAPEYADYIDGRSVPFGAALLLRNIDLLSQSLDSAEWVTEADARKINTIILSLDFQGGIALRALNNYCDARRWRPVFLDGSGAVFLRVVPETASFIDRLQIDCKTVQFEDPSATLGKAEQLRYLVNVAAILIVFDRNSEALQRLDQAERIFSENPILHYVKGIALGNLGFPADSERELRVSVELGSVEDAPVALARLYGQQGRYAEETKVLSRAAELSDRPHSLYLMLGNVQLTLGRPDLALASFNAAERESPFVGDAYSFGTEFRAQITKGRQRAMQMSRARGLSAVGDR
jgi:tetratricopeptide (TPR) repeat protein